MSIKRGKRRAVAIVSACALATAFITTHTAADTVSSTFIGGYFDSYSDPTNWDPAVVPNNAGTTTYNIDLGDSGVQLYGSATVGNVTGSELQVFDGGSFTVNQASSLSALSVFANTASTSVSLGSLAAYSSTNGELDNITLNLEAYGSNTAKVQFQGADIITNTTNMTLYGQAYLTDENGNDALRNLVNNTGQLQIGGRSLTVSGDFSNSGSLWLSSSLNNDSIPTIFTINGNLLNFDPTKRTLTSGTFVLTDSNGARMQFNNADIVHNEASIEIDYGNDQITDQNGNNALRNLADNSGSLTLTGGTFTTVGDFSSSGFLSLNSMTFSITGQFANFASNTLSGNFSFSGAILSFPNADIVNNNATINIGPGGLTILDENSNNGLRNFDHNLAMGSINLSAASFSTPGDFVNDGSIAAVGSDAGIFAPSIAFNLGGNLTNTGTISLGTTSYPSIYHSLATMNVAGIASNVGSVNIGGQGSLSASGGYVQTSGTTELFGGALQAPSITILGGLLGGNGKVLGTTTISGGMAPGGSPTFLLGAHTYGELQFQSPTTLTQSAGSGFHIGGTTRATSYDDVSASSSFTLAGDLDVALDYPISFLPASPPPSQPNYIPLSTDQFIILSAPEIDGEFDNAPDGSRLETTDGYGSFLVEYLPAENGDPAEVVLTDFETGTPEPTAMLGVFALPLLLGRRKRRQR